MSFTGLLNQEMSVRVMTHTQDAYMGQSISYNTVYSARPCRVNDLSDKMIEVLSRSGIIASHMIFCDADITVSTDNELVIGSTVYRAISVKDFDQLSHHLSILTKKYS